MSAASAGTLHATETLHGPPTIHAGRANTVHSTARQQSVLRSGEALRAHTCLAQQFLCGIPVVIDLLGRVGRVLHLLWLDAQHLAHRLHNKLHNCSHEQSWSACSLSSRSPSQHPHCPCLSALVTVKPTDASTGRVEQQHMPLVTTIACQQPDLGLPHPKRHPASPAGGLFIDLTSVMSPLVSVFKAARAFSRRGIATASSPSHSSCSSHPQVSAGRETVDSAQAAGSQPSRAKCRSTWLAEHACRGQTQPYCSVLGGQRKVA